MENLEYRRKVGERRMMRQCLISFPRLGPDRGQHRSREGLVAASRSGGINNMVSRDLLRSMRYPSVYTYVVAKRLEYSEPLPGIVKRS
jgi:hypothetical protein